MIPKIKPVFLNSLVKKQVNIEAKIAVSLGFP